jgi:UDP-sulfoquinovose synthase
MRIYNQFTEQFTVLELAELTRRAATEVGYDVEIAHVENPRVELEEHYYNAANTKLRELGLKPHYLGEELVRSVLTTIDRHKDRIIGRAIDPKTRWRPGEAEANAAQLSAAAASHT